MLSARQHDPAERYTAHAGNDVADYYKSLRSSVPFGSDIIRAQMIEIIDLLLRHEFDDFNSVLTFQRDRLELIVCYFDVFALADLVGFNDIVIVNRFARLSVDLQVTNAMAGPFLDQVESDLVALGRCGIERNWALHRRQLERALPIRSGTIADSSAELH